MASSNFSTLLPGPFSSWVLLAVILAIILHMLSRKQNLPPGPWHLVPFLGHTPNIVYALYKGVPLYKYLVELSKRYGSVYSFTAMGIPFVILNDNASIREAFQDTKLNDRGDNEMQAKLFSRSCKYNLVPLSEHCKLRVNIGGKPVGKEADRSLKGKVKIIIICYLKATQGSLSENCMLAFYNECFLFCLFVCLFFSKPIELYCS